jgi:hypothetical protein
MTPAVILPACLLLATLGICGVSPSGETPAVTPVTGSATVLADLGDGWRVRADPGRAGVGARWDAAGLNDGGWVRGALSRSAAGEPVWCRRWVDVPAGWPRVVLVLEGVAGRADLWVNGVAAGRDLARQRASGGAVTLDLARLAMGKSRCLLALRVAPGDDGPGAVGGAWLAADPRPWLPDVRDRLRYAATESPDLPWPSWLRGEGTAWTAFADPAGETDGLAGWRGELEGGERLGAVSCWLFDRAAGRLYAAPAAASQLRLEGRYLPLPIVTVRTGKTFALTIGAWPYVLVRPGFPAMTVAVGEVVVDNVSDRPREADLIVVVHPFSVRGDVLPVRRVRYDRAAQTFWVNDRPALVLAGAPDAVGCAAFGDDAAPGGAWALAQAIARGELPPAREAEDAAGLASAAAVYHLRIQPFGVRTQSFRLFLSGTPDALTSDLVRAVREVDRTAGWKEVRARWQKLVAGKERVFLRVPDKAAQDAFYASTGHLLVALAAGRVAPADRPLAAAALLRSGHAAAATVLVAAAVAWTLAPSASAEGLSASSVVEGIQRPADAFERAWAAARAGDGDGAGRGLAWWLAHPTTPGAFAWSARVDPATGRHAGGDLPDPRAAARFICALRDMLLREDGDALWLAPGLPAAWLRPGDTVDVRHLPTAFGILPGFVLASYPNEMALRRLSAERVANRGRGPVIDPANLARPPGGLRWRVPGTRRIRQVLVDGVRLAEVPADRVLFLPAGFREVRVSWRPGRPSE